MAVLAADEHCRLRIAARLQQVSFQILLPHTHAAAASPRQQPARLVCACIDTPQCLSLMCSLQRESERAIEREGQEGREREIAQNWH